MKHNFQYFEKSLDQPHSSVNNASLLWCSSLASRFYPSLWVINRRSHACSCSGEPLFPFWFKNFNLEGKQTSMNFRIRTNKAKYFNRPLCCITAQSWAGIYTHQKNLKHYSKLTWTTNICSKSVLYTNTHSILCVPIENWGRTL